MRVDLPAYEDGIVFSEKSAYKIQTSGNHPKESIQQIKHFLNTKHKIIVNIF